MKHIIPILIVLLLLLSVFVGVSNTAKEEPNSDKDINLNSYNSSEIFNHRDELLSDDFEIITLKTNNVVESQQVVNTGPMDSPWPMYCHDTRHTGRSPYSTVNTWGEAWRFKTYGPARGDPSIDEDGTIYIGAYDLHAVYPNGTEKWIFNTGGFIETSPAISEDGIIYAGTIYGARGDYLYAINPNGTLKWKYGVPNAFSSPAIGDDGTIYFGDSDNWYIKALYPNGTLKWAFKTGLVVYSSPAIGADGTVYCGSHDEYLYALYPNNGTLKWKYKTDDWIRVSPCIGDDGTIYVVSLDSYLHALYPNGTRKWKTNVGAGTSPTIGQDGTIYCGYSKLYAINPNSSVKWTCDVSGNIRGGTPCNSIDGTIYLGTDSGWIYAINPDGTVKWHKKIGECESAPAIGSDGTVYIGSTNNYLYAFGIGPLEADTNGPNYGFINQPVQFSGSASGGYQPYSWYWDFGDGNTSDEQNPLYTYTSPGNFTVTLTVTDNSSNTSDDTTWAWIQASNDPPDIPEIDGYTSGTAGKSYPYVFETSDIDGNNIWYYIDWDDGTVTGWLGPYKSGERITKSHTWNDRGKYTIRCKAKDVYGEESDWGEFEVTMPVNQQSHNWWFLQFLQNHPWIFPILRQLLGL